MYRQLKIGKLHYEDDGFEGLASGEDNLIVQTITNVAERYGT